MMMMMTMVETFEDAAITLKAPVAAVVSFVTVTSHTAFELQGALEEIAPILAIRFLTLTEAIVPSTSHKAWCLVWRIPSLFRD
jgi:hypothetical protein